MGLFDINNARLAAADRVTPSPQYSVPSHAHWKTWEFIYFIHGLGRIHLESQTLSARARDLVIYPPGLAHAETADPADPAEMVYLRIYVSGPSLTEPHIFGDSTDELGWLCQRIVSDCKTDGITDLAEAYTKAFLCLVERLLGGGAPAKRDVVDVAVRYIHANYDRPIGLDTLALAACVSKSYLTHRFRAKLGTNPLTYIREVRLDSAKRLLATTDAPVRKIAARVGFEDPLYFSRVFKRATGLAPTAFRRERVTVQSR